MTDHEKLAEEHVEQAIEAYADSVNMPPESDQYVAVGSFLLANSLPSDALVRAIAARLAYLEEEHNGK